VHKRRTIREAIKTALSGNTSAGARVFETRTDSWMKGELPAIAVYTASESVDIHDQAPRVITRTLRVELQACVRAHPDTDDAIDGLLEEIENAMLADRFFGGVCEDSHLTEVETGILEDGGKSIGWVRASYDVVYHTDAFPAGAVTDPLHTVDTRFTDLDGQAPDIHTNNQGHDALTLEGS
jgi:hypothetical protein